MVRNLVSESRSLLWFLRRFLLQFKRLIFVSILRHCRRIALLQVNGMLLLTSYCVISIILTLSVLLLRACIWLNSSFLTAYNSLLSSDRLLDLVRTCDLKRFIINYRRCPILLIVPLLTLMRLIRRLQA